MSPQKQLVSGSQIEEWLKDWGSQLKQKGSLILIGSGGLLWHAHQRNIQHPLPDGSMDVDPITQDEEIAELGYFAIMGSDFEKKHGWHVNLMPASALEELPDGWGARAAEIIHGNLKVTVPDPEDLLVPKLRRNEPRDRKHARWARENGLVQSIEKIETLARTRRNQPPS